MILSKKSTATGPITDKPTYFQDFDLDMVRNPATGDIIPLRNALAIKRSVRNLIMLNFGEKRWRPTIGSNVRQLLFDPMTPDVAGRLQLYITQVITTYETRVQLNNVTVSTDFTNEGYNISISYFLKNVDTNLQSISLFLERIR